MSVAVNSPQTAVPLQHRLSHMGGQLFPRKEVSVSRGEIQNFKAEIIGNESTDLCFLATGGKETYYRQNASSPLFLGLAVLFAKEASSGEWYAI